MGEGASGRDGVREARKKDLEEGPNYVGLRTLAVIRRSTPYSEGRD